MSALHAGPTVEALANGWHLVRTPVQLTLMVSDAMVVNVTLEPEEDEDGDAVIYLANTVVTANPDYQVTSRIGPFAPGVQLREVPIDPLLDLVAELVNVQRAPSAAVQAALADGDTTVEVELEAPRLTLHPGHGG